jgi:ketosteroid isomerase-like protein
MSDLQSVADRFEIETLRGEFTDAVMMRDYDRLASLFTPDGSVRIPHINAEATSREQIRAGVEQMQGYWTTSCRPRTRAQSSSRATPPLAVPTSQSSCSGATAART